jgi:hypothetical protein
MLRQHGECWMPSREPASRCRHRSALVRRAGGVAPLPARVASSATGPILTPGCLTARPYGWVSPTEKPWKIAGRQGRPAPQVHHQRRTEGPRRGSCPYRARTVVARRQVAVADRPGSVRTPAMTGPVRLNKQRSSVSANGQRGRPVAFVYSASARRHSLRSMSFASWNFTPRSAARDRSASVSTAGI